MGSETDRGAFQLGHVWFCGSCRTARGAAGRVVPEACQEPWAGGTDVPVCRRGQLKQRRGQGRPGNMGPVGREGRGQNHKEAHHLWDR